MKLIEFIPLFLIFILGILILNYKTQINIYLPVNIELEERIDILNKQTKLMTKEIKASETESTLLSEHNKQLKEKCRVKEAELDKLMTRKKTDAITALHLEIEKSKILETEATLNTKYYDYLREWRRHQYSNSIWEYDHWLVEYDKLQKEYLDSFKLSANEKSLLQHSKLLTVKDWWQLKEWWTGSSSAIMMMQLCYSANNSELNPKKFHEMCKANSPNVVLIRIKENDHVIGGYTSNSWNGNHSFIYDDSAFLFTLTQGFRYLISKPHSAIYVSSKELPHYGHEDLFLNSQNCWSFFPRSYSNAKESELTNGLINFTIDFMEVYYVSTDY